MIIIATPEMGKIGHQGLNSRIKIGTTKEFPTKSAAAVLAAPFASSKLNLDFCTFHLFL